MHSNAERCLFCEAMVSLKVSRKLGTFCETPVLTVALCSRAVIRLRMFLTATSLVTA